MSKHVIDDGWKSTEDMDAGVSEEQATSAAGTGNKIESGNCPCSDGLCVVELV